MLSSLPLITPRDAHDLWYTPTTAPSASPQHTTSLTEGLPTRRPAQSSLAALRADENFILQRKLNIARFGAAWIRPPGITKTYQAAMDEAAEREDMVLATEGEMEVEVTEGVEGEVDGINAEGVAEEAEVERDLDDEVPEAEGDEWGTEESEGAESSEEEGSGVEESLMERASGVGSPAMEESSELAGSSPAERRRHGRRG
ncbi:MAG: hypothetical protein M1833_003304 [Piccolia ochrophora]|nr:MAG: hypothetical protein M1833_003304 [Piccolia ochrophora]